MNKYKKVIRGDWEKELVTELGDSPAMEDMVEAYDQLQQRFNQDIKGELGGILWYLSQVAKEFGFTMDEIATYNLDQLAARQTSGTIQGNGDHR